MGICLIIVPVRILSNWLVEISKLIVFSDRNTMQLRCFDAPG